MLDLTKAYRLKTGANILAAKVVLTVFAVAIPLLLVFGFAPAGPGLAGPQEFTGILQQLKDAASVFCDSVPRQ